ncbi:MAG: sugar transferase [Cyclobacteriaceae bacterium]
MIPCYKSVKSLTDKILALILLVLLTPLMVVIAIVLYFVEGQVFFIQSRPGFLEKPFNMYKFITMRKGEYITPLGTYLRKWSLDELPQLWNVLRGDMSFIGPRPFLSEYLPLYSEEHKRRHYVMPGITGLAQVKGKNRVSWSEKLDLDIYYSDNVNLILDFKIILLTVKYFWMGCPGSYPASKFTGYSLERVSE